MAIHPGEHLAEELKELHMSAAALARHLKVPTNRIMQILNGSRDITADTALRLAAPRLGRVTGQRPVHDLLRPRPAVVYP